MGWNYAKYLSTAKSIFNTSAGPNSARLLFLLWKIPTIFVRCRACISNPDSRTLFTFLAKSCNFVHLADLVCMSGWTSRTDWHCGYSVKRYVLTCLLKYVLGETSYHTHNLSSCCNYIDYRPLLDLVILPWSSRV